ncbi:MAG: protein kinase [Planctomycetaceae bacterium]
MTQGEMMIGNYELKNCVASGSTTQIWEVTEPGSPVQLAMKLMLDEARKDPAEKAVLKHEFKVGQAMNHPSFLRYHKIEITKHHAFILMDFFRSPSLKTQITSNRTAIQSSFKKLAEALANAYAFMHQAGWLHRDIKPDNILVNRAGEARVIDFSLSSRVKSGIALMMAGKQKAIQGTRTYIAPETILKKPATPQTDMYSLGVTFFEVLTGQPPFAGDTPNELLKKHLGEDPVGPSFHNKNVTKDLDRIVLKLLAKDPAKRYDSMQDLESALRSVRCFEEDPLALQERKAQEAKDQQAASVDKRLDSRADADRVAKGITAPVAKKRERKATESFLREEAARAAAKGKGQPSGESSPAAGPTPAAPVQPMPVQPMPGQMMPGMGFPQMPGYPGMAYPQMPQPGMPWPGQMPPGMGFPQMPGYPGMAYPQIPQSGMAEPQPMPPGFPSPQPQMQPGQQSATGASQVPNQTPPVQTQPAQAAPPQPATPPAEEPREASLDDFILE